MWQAVAQVTGPLTLIAFIATIIYRYLAVRMKNHLDMIRSLPKEQREEIVRDYLRKRKIDPTIFSTEDQVRIYSGLIRDRKHRFEVVTRYSFFSFLALAVVFIAFMYFASKAEASVISRYRDEVTRGDLSDILKMENAYWVRPDIRHDIDKLQAEVEAGVGGAIYNLQKYLDDTISKPENYDIAKYVNYISDFYVDLVEDANRGIVGRDAVKVCFCKEIDNWQRSYLLTLTRLQVTLGRDYLLLNRFALENCGHYDPSLCHEYYRQSLFVTLKRHFY